MNFWAGRLRHLPPTARRHFLLQVQRREERPAPTNLVEPIDSVGNNVDAFVGALAEDHAPGADIGPLTKAVLVDQFTHLRDGDRFFYLNQFSDQELSNLLTNTSLSKIIERNSGVTNLQANVFYFQSAISGTVTTVSRTDRRYMSQPLAGVSVELRGPDGDLVATAVTDSQGRYRFDDLHRVNETGNYTVRVVLPGGYRASSPKPATALISRGDVNATVSFSLVGDNWGWTDPFDGWAGDTGHHGH
jgi:hypothetical protein